MEYYLVKGTVYVSHYMENDTYFEDMRLVKADSADQAVRKYEKYWSNKSSPYATVYHAAGQAEETIV